MSLAFIPRRFVKERLQEGWHLIPGHSYSPGEYAILMAFGGPCEAADIWADIAPRKPVPNRCAQFPRVPNSGKFPVPKHNRKVPA